MIKKLILSAAGLAVLAGPALALDKVRLVNSTKVIFETEPPYTAVETGIFKKHGLEVSIIHGAGGADSLQAVITGSQDIVWGNGSLGVISAYGRGAPVRALGSNIRGVGDLYWYVKADSPIKSFKDLKETDSFVYSSPGSTTDLTSIALIKEFGIKAKKVKVGGPPARTQLMSGQVSTGWSVFPLNKDLVDEGKIRIIGTGSQAKELSDVTIRVIAANANWLEKNRDVAKRFMKAMEEALKVTYTDPSRIETWAKRWKLKVIPYEWTTFSPIAGLDKLNKIALETNKIKKSLTAAQLKELVHPMGNKP
jgi:NitT/TauT family transport system substrate-binding protein